MEKFNCSEKFYDAIEQLIISQGDQIEGERIFLDDHCGAIGWIISSDCTLMATPFWEGRKAIQCEIVNDSGFGELPDIPASDLTLQKYFGLVLPLVRREKEKS